MTHAKVLEIFQSIQGEGPYMGTGVVFLRLFECNMHCTWCDTPASIGDTSRQYTQMSPDEILNTIKSIHGKSRFVSITGGEPLLQVDFLRAFLPTLQHEGMKVYLDTNGTLPGALAVVINSIDVVAMDLKLPSSTKQRPFWSEHRDFLAVAKAKEVFIKTVISEDTTPDDFIKAVDLVAKIAPAVPFIVQPNYFDMVKNNNCIKKCLELATVAEAQLNDVRIIPQIHKFMKVP